MKVKFLVDIGQWKKGETCEIALDQTWLIAKKLAEPVTESKSDDFDALFAEEVKVEAKPEPKPKTKIQPSNKAHKAPENK